MSTIASPSSLNISHGWLANTSDRRHQSWVCHGLYKILVGLATPIIGLYVRNLIIRKITKVGAGMVHQTRDFKAEMHQIFSAGALPQTMRWGSCPVWARERCRISPPRFMAECRMRRVKQALLLYFALFAFLDRVYSFCSVSIFNLSYVLYFPAWTNVNGTV